MREGPSTEIQKPLAGGRKRRDREITIFNVEDNGEPPATMVHAGNWGLHPLKWEDANRRGQGEGVVVDVAKLQRP